MRLLFEGGYYLKNFRGSCGYYSRAVSIRINTVICNSPGIFLAKWDSRFLSHPSTISTISTIPTCLLRWYIGDRMKQVGKPQDELSTHAKKLEQWVAQRASASATFDVNEQTSGMRARQKRLVCPLLHTGGLVVPVVNDVGYRPVPVKVFPLQITNYKLQLTNCIFKLQITNCNYKLKTSTLSAIAIFLVFTWLFYAMPKHVHHPCPRIMYYVLLRGISRGVGWSSKSSSLYVSIHRAFFCPFL